MTRTDFIVGITLTIAAIALSVIILFTLLGCTVYQPLPPPRVFNFSVAPLDPPRQDDGERLCIPYGWDGLACEDRGMSI